MTERRRIHDTENTKEKLAAITRAARVDLRFLHEDRTRAYIAEELAGAGRILDVGAGMRGALDQHDGVVESLDINDFGTYPDILGDICAPFPDWMHERYDAAIALAILEHVYDPPAAVENLRNSIKPGGRLFIYVPWIWRYHGPPNLSFQDYQRFSRDGLAYLLRDFEEITLYPIRGKYSAIVNLMKFWKARVERRFGGRINRLLDARASDWRNTVQASGFFAKARRPME